jgi:hypothetical protein
MRDGGFFAMPPHNSAMVAAGYMAKRVSRRPDWLPAMQVSDVYSVSRCVSEDFADWVNDWKHNGYWLFDSPAVIESVARAHAIALTGIALFFYEVHTEEFDAETRRWMPFAPEPSFATRVVPADRKTLEGFDVATFSVRTRAECSPLSCNALAAEIDTNQHCLLPSFEAAQRLLDAGRFADTEPGPFRIFAVYSVPWPAKPAAQRSLIS